MRSPGVDAHGCKVQLVFGLEDKRLAPNFQDGGRLEGRSYDKQSQLRMHYSAILCHLVLPVKILQSTVEVQGLRCGNKTQPRSPFVRGGRPRLLGINHSSNCACINVCEHVCVYQKARGVVEEATEAAAEAPLQEGRVLWWQLLRVVVYDSDVTLLLEAYKN